MVSLMLVIYCGAYERHKCGNTEQCCFLRFIGFVDIIEDTETDKPVDAKEGDGQTRDDFLLYKKRKM